MPTWTIWLSIFLIIGLVIAADVPFVFDQNSSDVAGYTSDQLEKISGSSPDLVGVPSISKPSGNKIIEDTSVINKSLNQSTMHNTTVSSMVLRLEYGFDEFVELNQSSVYNETTTLFEEFNVNLPPWYSQMITSPTYLDWFKEGNTNYDKGYYENALTCYDQAIKLNPYFPGAWYNKGIVLFRLEKYQESIKAFDESLEIDPDYKKALNGKDEALQAISRQSEVDAAPSNAK